MAKKEKHAASSPVHLKFSVLAVDIVVFSLVDNNLHARLVTVDRPPFFPKGSCGFPGGLITPSETAEDAVKRHLKEKALISPEDVYFEQLYTFSAIDRDPRGRVVAVSYIALTSWDKLTAKEQESNDLTWWTRVSQIGELAYDHNQILQVALKRLRSKIRYTTIISKLLPDEFSLGELLRAYEVITDQAIDKRNFIKKILKLDILEVLPYKRTGTSFRPAKLYRFKSNKIQLIEII